MATEDHRSWWLHFGHGAITDSCGPPWPSFFLRGESLALLAAVHTKRSGEGGAVAKCDSLREHINVPSRRLHVTVNR